MNDYPESATTREYLARTPISRGYFDRFCLCLPGGETRSVTQYDPYPIVVADGHGPLIYDVDGNEYLDVLNNYTALVHGHGFGPITEAVQATLSSGTVFPAPHVALLELGEMMIQRYLPVERVRFTNSGTEATLLALRIARAASGRERIVIFEGGYHGSVPEFIDSSAHTVRVPYNDADRACAAIDPSVAAVIAEPFLGSGGVIPGDTEFLHAVADRARVVGSLFVLDEVQSLRNAFHGMSSQLRLVPDLLVMGKVIGGGFPVGAVGGKESLMNLTTAKKGGRLSHSGTFNGNVVTTSAGVACLRALDESAISRLNRSAASLADGIEASARRVGVPVTVTRAGSILHLHLLGGTRSSSDARGIGSQAVVAQLHLALLLEGVYAAPRGMLNLSTALDDSQIAQVAVAYENAFSRIQPLISTSQPLHAGGR
jgi:glutamate-1-semialdehyde 2,1-aminomutase